MTPEIPTSETLQLVTRLAVRVAEHVRRQDPDSLFLASYTASSAFQALSVEDLVRMFPEEAVPLLLMSSTTLHRSQLGPQVGQVRDNFAHDVRTMDRYGWLRLTLKYLPDFASVDVVERWKGAVVDVCTSFTAMQLFHVSLLLRTLASNPPPPPSSLSLSASHSLTLSAAESSLTWQERLNLPLYQTFLQFVEHPVIVGLCSITHEGPRPFVDPAIASLKQQLQVRLGALAALTPDHVHDSKSDVASSKSDVASARSDAVSSKPDAALSRPDTIASSSQSDDDHAHDDRNTNTAGRSKGEQVVTAIIVRRLVLRMAERLGPALWQTFVRAVHLDSIIRAPLEMYRQLPSLSKAERLLMAHSVAEISLMNRLVHTLSSDASPAPTPPPTSGSALPKDDGSRKKQGKKRDGGKYWDLWTDDFLLSSYSSNSLAAYTSPHSSLPGLLREYLGQCHPVHGRLCHVLTTTLPARVEPITALYGSNSSASGSSGAHAPSSLPVPLEWNHAAVGSRQHDNDHVDANDDDYDKELEGDDLLLWQALFPSHYAPVSELGPQAATLPSSLPPLSSSSSLDHRRKHGLKKPSHTKK